MIVLIDVGNTRIKWATLPKISLRDPAFCLTIQHCPRAAWLASGMQAQLASALGQTLKQASQVWLSNVSGADCAQALHALANQAQWQVVQATPQALGVSNHYAQPAQLGVDRWLAALAVWQRFRQSALVVSAGTALTIDALWVGDAATEGRFNPAPDDKNQAHFLGGSIQPGLNMMLDSLHHGTAQLKPACPSPAQEADWIATQFDRPQFAQNTTQAMMLGCQQAMLGAILLQYQAFLRNYGITPRLVLTGGDAAWLHSGLAQTIRLHGSAQATEKAQAIMPLFPAIEIEKITYSEHLVCDGLAALAQTK